jgi:CRISPR-associated endonuclease/helicase Cas3
MSPTFDADFRALTGNDPFPWQRALYKRFVVADFPDACTLPTGLGKTSVVAVWLLALAANPTQVPRRLVYVVNRRTVVDQTTAEVEKYAAPLTFNAPPVHPVLLDLSARLRALCSDPTGTPLALSTLRGQFADNREWSGDPARPAVVVGTVDMIGSRLLFSGYGCGFKTRPLHAGFLGQDALLIHDEAHLEKPFQDLVEAIRAEQKRCGEFRPFHVTALTATPRTTTNVFRLTNADIANDTVKTRLEAVKKLLLAALKDPKKPAAEIAVKALAFKDSKRAVLVFARSVEAVQQVVEALKKDKAEKHVEQLTGTLRGLERDALATTNRVFARFLPPGDRKCEAADGTVYLVCTSAGEVGVNLSADDLVCDLTPFDSMAQRFGRVNRFGARDDTEIHVLHPPTFDPADALGPACERTLALLRELNGDASPAALGNLDEARKQAAFTPTPTILPTSDILFDSWVLTSVRGKLPGRPPVEPYLHGLAGWEPPETHVAWREEVEVLTEGLRDIYDPAELLEIYPLKPHELLRDRTDRVFKQLEKLAAETPVWLVDDEDAVVVTKLSVVIEKGKDAMAGLTVLLPPSAGGLANGLLSGDSRHADDVADEWYADADETISRRLRVWSNEAAFDRVPAEYREVQRIDLPGSDDDEDAEGRSWYWFERQKDGDDEGSKASKVPIRWQHHTDDVTNNATQIATALFDGEPDLGRLLILAARLHDLGKKRKTWQRSIGNPRPDDWYAKGGRKWKILELTKYRHEFGSLLDATDDAGFAALSEAEKQLVLHVVATHHGYARPHFPADRAFDPDRPEKDATEEARKVPRRFAALQRKYGRWGLAYLESLLRAADYAASARPSEPKEGSA